MGGGGKRPKIQVPKDPDPTATPIPGREQDEAKKKVRQRARRGGRQSTIFAGRQLAGRLNSQRGTSNTILNTSLSGTR